MQIDIMQSRHFSRNLAAERAADEMPRSAAPTGGGSARSEMKWGVGGAVGRRQSLFRWPKEPKWGLPRDECIRGAAKATLSINGFV